MKKWFKKAAPIVLVASMLVGCSFGGDKDAKKNETATLKVMFHDESSFFRQYGMLFSALHPNVEIEVVSTQSLYNRGGEGEKDFDPVKAKQEFLEKEKPDLIMLDLNEYETMAADGKLYDLETLMTRDKFKTEGIVPGMMDYMKELGGGKVYAMPTSVSSEVMFYNKSLFDKYNIEYPTDQMNWSEVLQLAKQFPTDGDAKDRVYGLNLGYNGDLNGFSTMLAGAEGLKYVNPTTKVMTINTPGWESAVQTALDAMKSKAIYVRDESNEMMNNSYEDYLLSNPFTSGRVAMNINGSYYIDELKNAKEYVKEEGKVVENWDMVTVPVSAQLPNESSNAWYGSIFGIAKDSPNADAAWKFISYISSEEYARVSSKTMDYNGLPIHTKYVKDDEGRNYAAFYKLKPSKNDYAEYQKLPKQFNEQFYGLMSTELKEVQDGKKEIKEALDFLQVKGEELLATQDPKEEEAATGEATTGEATTEEATPSATTETKTE
ncbi:extracellular solute-binding protein [Paenibacillus sp. GSMTC-2017]|uniref:extracellular solute-binding protein n=1 Tax=Paenibacillus sp. GSMTC-2017 TaxID=2794350 RepID=UPI0018D6F45A|nr:extracellular solute-binding protein [Paenibacillus sp. GSMTC-2017]MBH5319992.1 extracellular solute-binding protein [Paenibacillus sp. GSMTC-2017]